ncbi:GNAT family N-acetyltransferase [Photobacterium sp. MCCC 1A19761]|uniref:GNAT family N-acetyltransferase n=1 Tax=Photobacterium sp. MCCC 1A19761 TaxID=3115000 RepID=UPI00307E597E
MERDVPETKQQRSLRGSLALRPIRKSDQRFLRDLYCTSRDYEMSQVDLSESQKKAFLRQQFALQTKHYDKVYREAELQIIMKDGQPIGRLYADYNAQANQFHLIDITLLREYRGLGIGRYLIEGLKARAASANASLSLYVHSFNPALKFYQGLGFVQRRNEHGQLYLQWLNP